MAIIVKTGKQQLFFPEEPLCTRVQIEVCQSMIDQHYPDLVDELRQQNPDHAWLSKAGHGSKTADYTIKVLEVLGIDSQSANAQLLIFAARNHDWGRFVQAFIDAGNQSWLEKMGSKQTHGVYTVKLMEAWGLDRIFNQNAWSIISFCLNHHDNVSFVSLAPDGDITAQTSYLFCRIIRISDRFTTMLTRTAYYVSPEGIGQQIPPMMIECAKLGVHFQGEQGFLIPKLLEEFKNGHIFQRGLCQTYEDYIGPFYGGWLTDGEIDIPPLLRKIVDSGFCKIIINYLVRQGVPTEQVDTIRQRFREYLGQFEIKID